MCLPPQQQQQVQIATRSCQSCCVRYHLKCPREAFCCLPGDLNDHQEDDNRFISSRRCSEDVPTSAVVRLGIIGKCTIVRLHRTCAHRGSSQLWYSQTDSSDVPRLRDSAVQSRVRLRARQMSLLVPAHLCNPCGKLYPQTLTVFSH